MDWREILKNKTYLQCPHNPQYSETQNHLTDIADKDQNLKTDRNHVPAKQLEGETDIAFNILDCLLAGGLSCKISEWKKQCREAGVGELAIAMIRFVEAEDFVSFDGGFAKLKEVVR
jgi:hypothetical protein